MIRALICLVLSFSALDAMTIKEKLLQAEPGDYIVTRQENNYSFLCVHSISSSSISLEEITVPVHEIDRTHIHWPSWLAAQAPGHTAWVLYEIDLKGETLKQSYSLSEKKELYTQTSEYLLAQFLSIPLSKTPPEERKRIGPQPPTGEPDQRRIWNPPVPFEGKKNGGSEAWHAQWPKDDSPLSGCQVEIYFLPTFSLPIWLEVSNGHYTLKVHAIESGKGLSSCIK